MDIRKPPKNTLVPINHRILGPCRDPISDPGDHPHDRDVHHTPDTGNENDEGNWAAWPSRIVITTAVQQYS